MITATYTVSGIKDQMELMTLSGTVAGWMLMHPDTMLDGYEDDAWLDARPVYHTDAIDEAAE